MKIAIDLNDVVRDFSHNFLKCYYENYDHTFDFDDFEIWTPEMNLLLPFRSEASYEKFTYEDYVYNIFASCPTCYPSLTPDFNEWSEHTIKDIDTSENIDLLIVSSMEYGLSIPSTYVFIGKLGSKIRETFFPIDSNTIWDKCDVLVTANPKLLNNKPEGKISIKIKTEYNSECNSDFAFNSFKEFIKNKNNVENLLTYGRK